MEEEEERKKERKKKGRKKKRVLQRFKMCLGFYRSLVIQSTSNDINLNWQMLQCV